MPNRNVECTGEGDRETVCFTPDDQGEPTEAGEEASPGRLQAETAQYAEAAADDPSEVFSDEEEVNEQQPVATEPSLPTPGTAFLHERSPKFHASREVEDVVGYLRANGEGIPNQPTAKLTAYVGFLTNEEYVNDGIITGDQASIERQVSAKVIKAEDIPESYFDLQRRIARERGLGDQELTPDERQQHIAAIQADQKASLHTWAEYIGTEYEEHAWFKQYAWEGATKLGALDTAKGEFKKRSKGTAAPYPELNREALAYVHDALHKTHVQGEPIDDGERDPELQKHLASGNFAKLYAYALRETTPDMSELHTETEGSWIMFKQSGDPEAGRQLANSLQGYGTGWCTAGEATAQSQLGGGDFYVYRTRDNEGNDTIPRVAIRMEDGEVAEVRGIKADQELEPALAAITAEKLQHLPGSEAYIQKAEDMKRLTAIEQAIVADPYHSLTKSDIYFLYEIDRDIQGFGYDRDPRIQDIRERRRGRDKAELAHILSELTFEQADSTHTGYDAVATQLNEEGGLAILTKEDLLEQLVIKDREWQANGVYDYLAQKVIKGGGRITVVATPNVEATRRQIFRLAHEFSDINPYNVWSANINMDLYARGIYTSRQLSGNSGSDPVRFSLISSKNDSEMGCQTIDVHRRMLKERQTAHPELNIHVPSVLETLTYWYSLHAKYGRLDGRRLEGDLFRVHVEEESLVRHFDMEPQLLGPLRIAVPMSVVVSRGNPSLAAGDVDAFQYARLALG